MNPLHSAADTPRRPRQAHGPVSTSRPRAARWIPQPAATRRAWESELLRALLEYPTACTTRPLCIERVVFYAVRPVIRFAEDADANRLSNLTSWGLFPTGGEHDRNGVKGLRILDAKPCRLDIGRLGTSLGAGRDASPPAAGHVWPEVSSKVTQAQLRAAQDRTRPLPERTKSPREGGRRLMSTQLLTSAVDINGIRHLPTGSDTRRCQIGRSLGN